MNLIFEWCRQQTTQHEAESSSESVSLIKWEIRCTHLRRRRSECVLSCAYSVSQKPRWLSPLKARVQISPLEQPSQTVRSSPGTIQSTLDPHLTLTGALTVSGCRPQKKVKLDRKEDDERSSDSLEFFAKRNHVFSNNRLRRAWFVGSCLCACVISSSCAQ